MRRQRVLRTPSAQSLCIFCACRLGIELPTSQAAPFVSHTARRGLTSTSSSSQSAAAVATPSDASLSYDPTSSLSWAEQQEKAARGQRYQEQGSQDQSAKDEGSFEGVEKAGVPLSQGFFNKKHSFRKLQSDAPEASTGKSNNGRLHGGSITKHDPTPGTSTSGQLSDRRKGSLITKYNTNTPQKSTRDSNNDGQDGGVVRRSRREVDNPPGRRGPRAGANGNDQSGRPNGGDSVRFNNRRPGQRQDTQSSGRRGPARVANPFAAPVKAEKGPVAAAAAAGWGAGATETKPLEYDPREPIQDPVIEDVDDIENDLDIHQDPSRPEQTRSDLQTLDFENEGAWDTTALEEPPAYDQRDSHTDKGLPTSHEGSNPQTEDPALESYEYPEATSTSALPQQSAQPPDEPATFPEPDAFSEPSVSQSEDYAPPAELKTRSSRSQQPTASPLVPEPAIANPPTGYPAASVNADKWIGFGSDPDPEPAVVAQPPATVSADADEWVGFGFEEDDEPSSTESVAVGAPKASVSQEEQYGGSQPGVARQRPEPDAMTASRRGSFGYDESRPLEARQARSSQPKPKASAPGNASARLEEAIFSSFQTDANLDTQYSREQKSHLQDSYRSPSTNNPAPEPSRGGNINFQEERIRSYEMNPYQTDNQLDAQYSREQKSHMQDSYRSPSTGLATTRTSNLNNASFQQGRHSNAPAVNPFKSERPAGQRRDPYAFDPPQRNQARDPFQGSFQGSDDHLETQYSRDQRSHLQDSYRSPSSNYAAPGPTPQESRPQQWSHQPGAWGGMGGFGAQLQSDAAAQQNQQQLQSSASFPASQQPEESRAYSQRPRQDDYSNTGYRTMPFDPREMQSRTSSGTEDSAEQWQHFQPKRNNSPEGPAPQQQQQQQEQPFQPFAQRRSHELDASTVDEMFAKYQQQRPQRQAPPSVDVSGEERPYEMFNRFKNYRCARCHEMGHHARDCTNSPKRRDPRGPREPFNAGYGGRRESRRVPNPFEEQGDQEQGRFTIRRSPSNFEEGVVRRTPSDGMSERDSAQASYAGQGGRRAQSEPYSPPAGSASYQPDAVPRPAFSGSTDTPETAEEKSVEELKRNREKAARASRWADPEEDEDDGRDRRGRKGKKASRRDEEDEDDEGSSARDAYRAKKSARKQDKEAQRRRNVEERKAGETKPITLPEFINIQHLSQMLGVRYEQFVERLEELGYDDVFPGKTLNSETSGMIAMEYNFEPTFEADVRQEEERDLKPSPVVEDTSTLPTRPPVVTIMGHVDHGKTTILDYLRKSSVAAGEAGGITQHIGAFSVPLSSSGKTITFLDTPGHAAFLAMRQRGANVTDIVILVVAADDSVKPQTLEAIKHAKAAKVPMIVAINKVDKPEADIERCKQDLARHGVEIEDFGGDTQVVCVSGKTGQGMDDLEETVVTLSEILDHRAEQHGTVEGWVLEATTKQNGRVATVLVRRGTLTPGTVIVAGKTWARVRTLKNEGGQTVSEVGPGMPVEVDGWRDQPVAGDEVLQASTEQKATSVVEFRLERAELEKTSQDMEAINKARQAAQIKHKQDVLAEQAAKRAAREGVSPEDAAAEASAQSPAEQEEQSGQMTVPFIIKADVSGSVEAVSAYIMSVSNPLIAPKVLQAEVGKINESDIELASAAQGNIIAFNLPTDQEMNGAAEARGVKVLENNVIYRVLDDIKAVLEEKLPPLVTQRVLGEAEIAANFEIGIGGRKKMKIAGCKVRNGAVSKGSMVRVTRNGEKVYDGIITSLKNVKKEVQEMRKGTECGMGFEKWEDFQAGDLIQTYEEVSERRRL